MPKIITAAAVIKCAHQGTVTVTASQTNDTIGGNPILVMGDLVGKPIAGCTNPASPSTKPCTATTSMLVGQSMKVTAGGKAALLDTATGLTDSVPPGTWSVQSAGQTSTDSAG